DCLEKCRWIPLMRVEKSAVEKNEGPLITQFDGLNRVWKQFMIKAVGYDRNGWKGRIWKSLLVHPPTSWRRDDDSIRMRENELLDLPECPPLDAGLRIVCLQHGIAKLHNPR